MDQSVDIRYEVNHEGDWQDALCRLSEDHNNKAFWRIGDNGSLNDTGVIARGDASGEFREK